MVRHLNPEQFRPATRVTAALPLPLPEREKGAQKPARRVLLSAGTRVDDYVVQRVIASGGFGTVYEAIDRRTGRSVALKLLHERVAHCPDMRERFAREAAAIKEIEHPNIVRLLDYGTYMGRRPYHVMELLRGLDLSRFLKSTGPLPLVRALEILKPLCDALAAAHDKGILHRDIKASNVFIAKEGGGPRVVLVDFGIAKRIDDEQNSLTCTGQTLGTPGSMAPEQLIGAEVSPRTDVYALGILLFQMLTGVRPFHEAAPDCLSHMHLHGARPRPSRYAKVSPAIDRIVVRAMSRRPEDRYAGARELAAALREVALLGSPASTKVDRRLAVYVEVHAARERLIDPDDALLDFIDDVGARTLSRLSRFGFELVESTARVQFLCCKLPEANEIDIRSRCVVGVVDLERELRIQSEAVGGVDVHVHLDVAVDGVTPRIPDLQLIDGVTVSPGVLEGIRLPTVPVPGLEGIVAVRNS